MAVNIDLNVIPIHAESGQYSPQVAGLKFTNRPRRPARSRQSDQLILFTSLSDECLLSESEYQELLETLSLAYYKKTGSVTGAMREVAQELNQYLQQLNCQSGDPTKQVSGSICQLVRREDQIYLGISGSLQVLFIGQDGVRIVTNPALTGAGLGAAKSERVQYFHASLKADDTFLITTRIPPKWTADFLSSFRSQGPESIRRRLIPAIDVNSDSLIIQAKAGEGKLNILQLTVSSALSSQAEKPVSPSSHAGSAGHTAGRTQTSGVPVQLGENPESQQIPSGETVFKGVVQLQANTAGVDQASLKRGTMAMVGRDYRVEDKPLPSTPKEQNRLLGLLLFPIKVLLSPFVLILRLISSTLDRMIPGENLAIIPNSTMAFFSLIVPVIIVAIGTTVYIRNGITTQSTIVYEQALGLVAKAEQSTDVIEQRGYWKMLVEHLEKTDLIYVIPDAVSLRESAQAKIDQIDKIKRVDYQPAIIGGLPPETYITRIVLGDDEIFLLDRNSGNVLHATLSDQGYLLDQAFQCGPGSVVGTEELIDIVPWPSGYEPQASILGVDEMGSLMFCDPGSPPVSGTLTKPENREMEDLGGMSMGQGNLYVLDPVGNAVWIYWNGNTDLVPQNYFENQVPNLGDVVDMIVTNDELYLLHEDGHLTMCQFGWMSVSPTSCIDPVKYLDTRKGRENTELIPEYPFSQLANNPPPDPSLYLLEGGLQSIYHFSLRSPAFQHLYMPSEKLGRSSSTAFAVNSFDRLFYLANGNDVYYARIP